MRNSIHDLFQRFRYSEQLEEIAVFRILLGGEDRS
jgi:hypothetical protein